VFLCYFVAKLELRRIVEVFLNHLFLLNLMRLRRIVLCCLSIYLWACLGRMFFHLLRILLVSTKTLIVVKAATFLLLFNFIRVLDHLVEQKLPSSSKSLLGYHFKVVRFYPVSWLVFLLHLSYRRKFLFLKLCVVIISFTLSEWSFGKLIFLRTLEISWLAFLSPHLY